MPDKLVVFHNGSALVIIETESESSLSTMNQLLDWYSEKYEFERHKLTGAWLQTVTTPVGI